MAEIDHCVKLREAVIVVDPSPKFGGRGFGLQKSYH